MKLTKLDKLVALGFVLNMGILAATTFLISYFAVDGFSMGEVAEYFEANPLARVWLSLEYVGTIIWVVLVAVVYGSYFVYFRTFQFREDKDYQPVLNLIVVILFLVVVIDFIKDVSMLLGVLMK